MKHIHFIGIGGIGTSALAKYYLAKDYKISGCDLSASEITDQLKSDVELKIGKSKKSCINSSVDLLVYTTAATSDHPDLVSARELNIPNSTYAEALGELTKDHYTIAVSGTHGKSTTTSMLGILLMKAGLDPTVIVGTKVKEFGNSNCRIGKGKYLVIEADEYAASFLNYHPNIIVLTSLEADHLDYYKTFSKLFDTFKRYLENLESGGYIVANSDDKNIAKLVQGKSNVHKYSLKQKEAIELRETMKIPGEHNIANALAAFTASGILKVSKERALSSLSKYKGSWRRFEIFKMDKPCPYTLVSDYGHHPTEIAATIQGARAKWPNKDIWLIYQPHQYHRTYVLFDDFVKTLSKLPINRLVLADIYDVAGREDKEILKQVSSKRLAQEVAKEKVHPETILHITPQKKIADYLKKELKGGEIVLIMGAGTIYNLTIELTKKSKRGRI